MGWEVVSKDKYLYRRDATYYVRRRVPSNLKFFVGREHITKSLRTSNYREALRRCVFAAADIQKIFDEAKAKLVANDTSVPVRDRLSRQAAKVMVTSWFDEQISRVGSQHDEKMDQDFAAGCKNHLDGPDEDFEKYELAADIARCQMPEDAAGIQRLKSITDGILRSNGYPTKKRKVGRITLHANPDVVVDKSSPEYRYLLDLVRDAHLDVLRTELGLLEGNPVSESDLRFGSQYRAQNGQTDICLSELVDRFQDDPRRAGLRTKTKLDYGMIFRVLCEVIGADKPVRRIDREDARAVYELLRVLPSNATKLFPNKPLKKAVRLGAAQKLPTISDITVASYLSKTSTIFEWAVREEYADRNPAKALGPAGLGTHMRWAANHRATSRKSWRWR